MVPLPLRPAALLVMTSPPQSPGAGLQTDTRIDGHETAFPAETSSGGADALGLSLRLVKMALRLGDVGGPAGVAAPVAVTDPPLMVIGPPRDFTTSPAPTIRFFAWTMRPPSNR